MHLNFGFGPLVLDQCRTERGMNRRTARQVAEAFALKRASDCCEDVARRTIRGDDAQLLVEHKHAFAHAVHRSFQQRARRSCFNAAFAAGLRPEIRRSRRKTAFRFWAACQKTTERAAREHREEDSKADALAP